MLGSFDLLFSSHVFLFALNGFNDLIKREFREFFFVS